MEQLSFEFFTFKVGDLVEIKKKSIGKKIKDYNNTERFLGRKFKVQSVKLYPRDWYYYQRQPPEHRLPKAGEKYYTVDGNYYLSCDLRRV